MTDQDRPLTTREVAEKLGVSIRRVQQYAVDDCLECAGEGCRHCEYTGQRLPGAYKIDGKGRGGSWLIPRKALYYFRRRDAYRRGWEKWQERIGGNNDTEKEQTEAS